MSRRQKIAKNASYIFTANKLECLEPRLLMATNVSGTLPAGTTIWDAANGPFNVTGAVTVPVGGTLQIKAGVTVQFNTGTGLLVNGTLDAEGTAAQHIRMTRSAGATNWKGIDFEYTTYTPNDNRLHYVDEEFGDAGFYSPSDGSTPNVMVKRGRVDIDHMTWSGTSRQLVNLIGSSIRMSNSILPSISGAELVHFVQMPSTGFAIFDGNTFGVTSGYNDIVDLTGGKRPGPIAQFLNNTFLGNAPSGVPGDDILDLDGTDAHIEGNVFLNVSPLAAADTNSAISGGSNGSAVSNITSVRNFFYNVDHAYLMKEGNFVTSVNNTYVKVGTGVYNFDEPGHAASAGRGAYIDGDIIYGLANGATIFKNIKASTQLSLNHSIIPIALPQGVSGTGNIITTNPGLMKTVGVTDPRQDFMLQPNSAAIGAGPNGSDMGAAVPAGASIAGEPTSLTPSTSVTLTVGRPDIYAYKYRVNGGPWSAEIAATGAQTTSPKVLPIYLSGLTDGQYTVEVVAKNSAGVWQADAQATSSKTWTVQTLSLPLTIQETQNADNYYFRQSPDHISVEIFASNGPNGNPAYTLALRASLVTLNALGGDDSLTIDSTNGFPIPAGGLQIDGGQGTNGLGFIGNSAANLDVTGGDFVINSDAGGAALSASGSAHLVLGSMQHLKSLSLSGNATGALVGGAVIHTAALAIGTSSVLDLGSGSLILDTSSANRGADLVKITDLIKSGRAVGTWNGSGINSSAAAAEPNYLTGLAIAVNDKGDGTPLYTTFDGEPVDTNSILVKYTWNGDADLSGKIDADDYFQIDNGFAQKLTGYRNGDFDFNGSVDADDYFLIDRAFAGQTGVLATHQPAASAITHMSGEVEHRRTVHHRARR